MPQQAAPLYRLGRLDPYEDYLTTESTWYLLNALIRRYADS